MTNATPVSTADIIIEPYNDGPDVEWITARFLAGYQRKTTREAYTFDLKLWFRWLRSHGIEPMGIDRATIELWARVEEERGLAPATISRRLSTVRMWYRWCYEEGILARDPGIRVRMPKVPSKSNRKHLDKWDMSEVVRLAHLHPNPSVTAMICLLTFNGLRISEALNMDIVDLDVHDGADVAHIVSKGGEHDVIPLTPPTVKAVAAATKGRTEGAVLLNTEERRMTRRNAADALEGLCKQAKITKRITPHSLRHSFITLAWNAGVADRDVQMSARHIDGRTTARYDRDRHNLNRHAAHVVTQHIYAVMRDIEG